MTTTPTTVTLDGADLTKHCTRLSVMPISLATANAFVAAWHRHSGQVQGHRWSVGAFGRDLTLHGVAIVGRPVSRALDDGATVEVTRLATDGARNLCSLLYGAARREARRRGYTRVVTYTLVSETGASLRAAGFVPVAAVRPDGWDRPSRVRKPRPAVARTRWESA